MSESASVTSLDFGMLGGASRRVAVGWSFPERDFTWTLGEESMILLDRPQDPGDYLLQITCNPALVPGSLPAQRVYVLVNRWYAGTQRMDHYGTYEVRVGWDVMRDHAHVSIGLLLPDAFRPCDVADTGDTRRIALAVSTMSLVRLRGEAAATPRPMTQTRAQVQVAASPAMEASPAPPSFLASQQPRSRTEEAAPIRSAPAISAPAAARPGPPLDEQMLDFESIGADPEFGLVQRRCGAEPLGLLRFAEAPLERLIAGLDAGFAGIGAPGTVDVTLRGREFLLRESRYGLLWHSWTYEGQANPQQVIETETQRLDFLRSKLMQDLAEGHKLLIYKREAPLAPAETEALLAAIRRHGPSALLLVEQGDGPVPVEQVAPGLMRGRVARFAPVTNPDEIAEQSWVAMARAAHRLWQEALVG